MSCQGSISLVAILLTFFFSTAVRAATNQASPWIELHSAHFTVITDAGQNKGREVALRFEQMRAVFANLLTKDRLNQSVPLTIFAFGDDRMYFQLAPLKTGRPIDIPGFLLTGEDQDFIALNLSEPEPWRAVAHDFALMLLSYNYPPTEEWFDEGLTEYFSSLRIENRQVQIGGEPQGKPGEVTELLKTQAWLSLPDLFATKTDLSARGSEVVSLSSAESWIVMHYLLHEKKLPETGTYFGLVLNQHVPVEDAIHQAYGMPSAQLQQAIKDYFNTNFGGSAVNSGTSAAIEHYPVPVGADDSVITSNPLSLADARALYAGVQIRVPERRDLGLKTLQDLANTPTEADKKSDAKRVSKRMGEDEVQLPSNAIGNEIAHRTLAWDDIQHGQYDEAFKEIGDAAQLNPQDMWVRYYLCVAKYRMAQAKHSDILGLANMMIDLRSVLEWHPEMASAYDLLAVARNAGGSTPAALQSERAAISLSPRDQLYLYHLAQIYVASKKWEAAGSLLNRLKTSNDPHIVQLADDLLSQAGVERKYGIPANSATTQPQFQPQKSPFDVLEQDEAKREAAEKTLPTGTLAEKPVTKFLKGRLVSIDCSKSPVAILMVNSGNGILKIRTADYRSILLIGADDFSCGWHNVDVTVNYKPLSGNDGDLVSLEVH
jgi:tetratricopeptide (TPR) repeat protein